MTRNQRMFTKAVRAIRKQGVACTAANGDCMYRGPKGLKCIAGHLIPDTLYNPFMENSSISFVIMGFPKLKEYFQKRYSVMENTLRLLNRLQTAHDSYLRRGGMEGFEMKIAEIAKEFHLTVPV